MCDPIVSSEHWAYTGRPLSQEEFTFLGFGCGMASRMTKRVESLTDLV